MCDILYSYNVDKVRHAQKSLVNTYANMVSNMLECIRKHSQFMMRKELVGDNIM
jgi:hypothetical protein